MPNQTAIKYYYNKKASYILYKAFVAFGLRRARDSNPRNLSQFNSFQDCRNRPLCQLSGDKSTKAGLIGKFDVKLFLLFS